MLHFVSAQHANRIPFPASTSQSAHSQHGCNGGEVGVHGVGCCRSPEQDAPDIESSAAAGEDYNAAWSACQNNTARRYTAAGTFLNLAKKLASGSFTRSSSEASGSNMYGFKRSSVILQSSTER